MKNFLSLKNEEYLAIAPKIFENANVLFSTAHDAAEKENYGVACSLTILGTEELIKGLVVKLRGYKANVFKVKELSQVFSNHIKKHETILLLKGASVIFEISKNLHTKPSGRFKPNSNRVERIGNAIIKVIGFIRPIANLIEDFEWWEKANELKNNGLYVNFINSELLPQQITMQEYINCKNKSTKVKEKTYQLIEYLEDEDSRIELIKLINEAIDVHISFLNPLDRTTIKSN